MTSDVLMRVNPPASHDLERVRNAVLQSRDPEAAAAFERVIAHNAAMREILGNSIGVAIQSMKDEFHVRFNHLDIYGARLTDSVIAHFNDATARLDNTLRRLEGKMRPKLLRRRTVRKPVRQKGRRTK
jgi:hypothetical protein